MTTPARTRKPQTFVLNSDAGRSRVLDNAIAFLRMLPESKPWELEIRPHVKKRSAKQRRAMFGAAYGALMEFSGLEGSEDKRELHRFMCGEWFGWKADPFGRRVPVRTTTRDEEGQPDEISVGDALEFYAFLQRRGAEVGCFVPDPDPFWREAKAA